MSYSKRAPRRHLRLLSVLLTLWMPLCRGLSIQLKPSAPYINGTVLLDVSGVALTDIRNVVWYKGTVTDAPNQILSYIPGVPTPQTNGPRFFPQASCFPNGSLFIVDLKKEFEGNYTVQIQLISGPKQETVLLRVKDTPDSGVTPGNDGLSPGAVAGIVIAVLVIVTIVLVVGFLVYKKYKTNGTVVSRGPPSNTDKYENVRAENAP